MKAAGGLALAGVLGILAMPAQATEILTVSDGVTTKTVSGDGSGVLGFASSSFPGWAFAVGGAGTPLIGTDSTPDLHLNFFGVGAGTLTISLQDDGFLASGLIQPRTQIGGVLGDGATMTLAAFSTAGDLLSFGPLGPGLISAADYASQTINGAYGLGLTATITSTKPSAMSFDADVSVPEPATLALVGAAMLGSLVFFGRRRATMPV